MIENRSFAIASYLVAGSVVVLVLRFHLLAAVFAGLTVHVQTVKHARRLPSTWARWALEIAIAVIAVLVIAGLTGIVLGLWSFLVGKGEMGALPAMEAVFGVAGLVAAPVACAWLKAEMKERGLL